MTKGAKAKLNGRYKKATDLEQTLIAWGKTTALVTWAFLAIVGAIALLLSVWTAPLPFGISRDSFPKFDSLGILGDAFGVVTSLASLLTLLVAMKVYELQRVELEKTTAALQDQHREAQINRAESRINEGIEDYRAQLDSIVMPSRNSSTGQNEMLRGRDALFHLWRHGVFEHLFKLNNRVATYDLDRTDTSTVFTPGTKLHMRYIGEVHGPEWIAAKLHDPEADTTSGCKQDVLIAMALIERWKELVLIHKYQIEPLVMTLLAAFRRITTIEDEVLEIDERGEHALRLVSQVSSIELTYLLCYCLFEHGGLSQDLRNLANDVGLFTWYAPGLDVSEHVLMSLANNRENIANRVQDSTVNVLETSAFTRARSVAVNS
jgi:hypothetical protein